MPQCFLRMLTLSMLLAAPPPRPAAPSTGELRILLLVVDGLDLVPRLIRRYENAQVTNPAWSDVATIHDFAFVRDTSLASLYEEMSHGQTTLVGDTIGMALPFAANDLTWTWWTARRPTPRRSAWASIPPDRSSSCKNTCTCKLVPR